MAHLHSSPFRDRQHIPRLVYTPTPMTAPAPNSQASDRPPSPARSGDAHRCQWVDCTLDFSDPEVLYNHLCNDHIGRKSTNNLCLTCKWKDCTVTCAKRDHITSHMRGTSQSPSLVVSC